MYYATNEAIILVCVCVHVLNYERLLSLLCRIVRRVQFSVADLWYLLELF